VAARRRFLTGIFIFAAAVYALTAGGHLYNVDGFNQVTVAQLLVTAGRLDAPSALTAQFHRAPNGRFYSARGIGASLGYLPAAAVGTAVARLTGYRDAFALTRFAASFVNGVYAAATITMLAALALGWGWGPGVALGGAATFGFATLAWPYAKDSFDVTLTALLFVATYGAALRASSTGGRTAYLQTGVFAALAVVTRLDALVMVAVVAAFLTWGLIRRRGPGRLRLGLIAWFVAPVAAALGWEGWYNYVRTGSVFTSPLFLYYPSNAPGAGLIANAATLLFAPGKGLFLFAPPALLFFPGLALLARGRRREAALLGAVVVSYFLSRATVDCRAHLWSWGPRFLVPLLPLVMLAAAAAFRRRGWLRTVAVAVTAVGLAVQLIAIAGDYENWYEKVSDGRGDVSRTLYDWRLSPLVGLARQEGRVLARYARGDAGARNATPADLQSENLDFWWVYLWARGYNRAGVAAAAAVLTAVAAAAAAIVGTGLRGGLTAAAFRRAPPVAGSVRRSYA
jgi:hypothetical protein